MRGSNVPQVILHQKNVNFLELLNHPIIFPFSHTMNKAGTEQRRDQKESLDWRISGCTGSTT